MSVAVGILFNPHKPAIEKYLDILIERLARKGLKTPFALSTEGPEFVSRSEFPSPIDYLLVLGGDGSVLRAMQATLQKQIPVIGVNFGRFGFLTRFEIEEVIDPDFNLFEITVSRRLVLGVRALKGVESLTGYALNDVVVHRPLERNIEHYHIRINGESLPFIAGDGVILSTPTGSTAYSLSAGGAIIYPQAFVFQITLLAPHTMARSPIILDDGSVVQLEKNPPSSLYYSLDGFTVKTGDSLEVRRAPYDFLLASPKGESLSAIISEKFLWGRRG